MDRKDNAHKLIEKTVITIRKREDIDKVTIHALLRSYMYEDDLIEAILFLIKNEY
ncbi:MAG: hypothetical protein WBB37_07490 [bacterium]